MKKISLTLLFILLWLCIILFIYKYKEQNKYDTFKEPIKPVYDGILEPQPEEKAIFDSWSIKKEKINNWNTD